MPKWVMVVTLSCIQLFVNPWTVGCQVPLSMEFSRQEDWNGLPFLLQEIFPTQGLNPGLPYCRQMLYSLSHQKSCDLNHLFIVFSFRMPALFCRCISLPSF